jgi:hypothetical protein
MAERVARSVATSACEGVLGLLAIPLHRGSDRCRASRTAAERLARNRVCHYSEKSMESPRCAYLHERPIRSPRFGSGVRCLGRVRAAHRDLNRRRGPLDARLATRDHETFGAEAGSQLKCALRWNLWPRDIAAQSVWGVLAREISEDDET